MTAIADLAKVDAANTRFMTGAQDVFARDEAGQWGLIAETIPAGDSTKVDLLEAGAAPLMRKWIGEKQFSAFRLYDKKVVVEPYEASMELRRRDILKDTTGVVNRRLDQFLKANAYVYDKFVWEKYLTNPTGIDGVSILNDSHPFSSTGSTWDNKVTSDLTYSSYNTGVIAMAALKKENGEFFGLKPTHLFCGPKLRRTAMEITGAERPVVFTTAGAEATSGTANSAITLPNVYQGDVTVVIIDRFADGSHDDDWFLYDANAGAPPIAFVTDRAPEAITQTAMDDEQRFLRDRYRFSLEADFGVDGYCPWAIYGRHAG